MSSSIQTLIASADGGDRAAAEALFTALYSELHRLARRELARCGSGVTLSATTLLHEAYLDISGRDKTAFPDRARFMGYAARVMRGLIINFSRNRQALKRGGQFELTSIGGELPAAAADHQQLQGISDALEELAAVEPELAQIVDLKFFCGFTFVEIAAMRAVSERTIQRQWEKARIYLHRFIRDSDLDHSPEL